MFDIELSEEEVERILFWLDASLGLESDEEENSETIMLIEKLAKLFAN